MAKKRIFTFGCSFTEYCWPTWADMLLYENNGMNYGMSGGGFDQILTNLIQCDIDNNLTSDDVIIIVYPNLIRWDGPFYPIMKCYGNAMTSELSEYENRLWTIDGLIYRNLHIIYIIDVFLQHKKVTYRYSSIIDIFKYFGQYFGENSIDNELRNNLNKTKEKIKLLTNFAEFTDNDTVIGGWKTTKKWSEEWDNHPRPLEHYNWLTDVLLPAIDVNVNINKEMVNEMERQIDKMDTRINSQTFFKQGKYFKNRFL